MPDNSLILSRKFYEHDTVTVAKQLLGMYFVRKLRTDILIGKIVETEAYLAFDDPAAHNYIGRTLRNDVLFGKAGHAYVHSIHRYHCIDIVTEGEGKPGSVLIRALEPLEGLPIMMKNRNTSVPMNLTNGPGKLCQAFTITRELNGLDVTLTDSLLHIIKPDIKSKDEIVVSTRIGISKAKDLPLRFSIRDNPFVSKPVKI